MYSQSIITLSPMQTKLFTTANTFLPKKSYSSTLSERMLSDPQFGSMNSKLSSSSYSNVNGNFGKSLFLSPASSQFSQISNNSHLSKSSSSSSKIKNAYVHTEFDNSSKRVKSSFIDKPIPIELGIQTGMRYQSTPSQENYKRKFYSPNGQLKEGVIYNKSFGQNNIEVEEFEDTQSPFNYFKICTRDGEVLSTTAVRPQQISTMLQKGEYLPISIQ